MYKYKEIYEDFYDIKSAIEGKAMLSIITDHDTLIIPTDLEIIDTYYKNIIDMSLFYIIDELIELCSCNSNRSYLDECLCTHHFMFDKFYNNGGYLMLYNIIANPISVTYYDNSSLIQEFNQLEFLSHFTSILTTESNYFYDHEQITTIFNDGDIIYKNIGDDIL